MAVSEVIASGLDGGVFVNGNKVVGEQVAVEAAYTITWTANEPTAGDSATIADGDTPTVAETGQAIADLTAKLNVVLATLKAHGLMASS